eukprot:4099803-Pyramimonas_sp.AAC.1
MCIRDRFFACPVLLPSSKGNFPGGVPPVRRFLVSKRSHPLSLTHPETLKPSHPETLNAKTLTP